MPSNDRTCKHIPGFTNSNINDDCFDELAEFLNKTDQSPLPGDQTITTYTVGFLLDSGLLRDAARKGGGKSYVATSPTELLEAFTQITTQINATSATFSAPAVTVNAFNRISNREELFFTLFRPSFNEVWPGNLKRYRLGEFPEGSGNIEILDVNGNLAIDSATGFFGNATTSFWTDGADAPDGSVTEIGGAAREFGTSRNVYTYLGTSNNLAATSNRVISNNQGITDAMLGKAGNDSEPSRSDLLNWLSGLDVQDANGDGQTDDARRQMGDPLHTKPVLVTYGSTSDDPDLTLYMTTNEGVLHAIDIDDGSEVFTYVPPEQLKNTLRFFLNQSTGTKAYGIDGSLGVFFRDVNGDGILQSSEGDRYVLVVGERRGGTRYYAIDITNRSAPQFLWTITGRQGGTLSGSGDFYELGQTWSAPTFAKVRISANGSLVIRDTVIFGGGYDPDKDAENTARFADDSGRAVYMIDVYTGQLLWWAGKSGISSPDSTSSITPNLALAEMNYSIPSDIRTIDINDDGFVDRLYFGDMGGQIWRIDFDNFTNSGPSDFARGTVLIDTQIATAGASPTAASDRRFFYPVDTSLVLNDGSPYLALAVGSGNRSHPLNTTVQNRFYVLRDNNPFTLLQGDPANISYPTTLTEGDLTDVTTTLAPPSSTISGGWYIQLANSADLTGSVGTFVGEKILAEAVTIQGIVLFTTYTPNTRTSTTSCAPLEGTGSLFAVNVSNGRPIFNFDKLATVSRADRTLTLKRSDPPPPPSILFPPINGAPPFVAVGSEKIEKKVTNSPVRTYWYEQVVQ